MANVVVNEKKNEVAKKMTVSQALASNAIKQLGTDLHLTDAQKMKASSSALSLSQNDKLKNCDGLSLVRFCFETARYNFGRDDCVYPVPYGDKIQAQVSYKGFRELALRAGYKEVDCSEVYDCDRVYRDRETGQIRVEFEEDVTKMEKAKLIGFYAYAVDSDGTMTTLYWSILKCQEHGKKYSKSYGGLWTTEFNKMAKKTVIKQLCSVLRSTDLLESARKMDQIVYGKDGEENDYLDNPLNVKKTNKVNNKLVRENVIEVKEETGEVVAETPVEEMTDPLTDLFGE